MSKILKYTGKVQPKPGDRDPSGQIIYPYLPGEELIEAVNLAIDLRRPLLIKGEPGTGKTRLAQAVAYELNLPLQTWYVKSISRALDGLYTYDTVGRLRDAQLAYAGRLKADELLSDEGYINWGPMGKAFLSEVPAVLLIDEIDKADMDFPNDLLLELDQLQFEIQEINPRRRVEAKEPPLVIITSNDEKDLPDAFLRRCLFHFIKFPDNETLTKIINARFPKSSPRLVKRAIARFRDLREQMEGREEKGEVGKNVSTSELIDWFTVLQKHPDDEALKKLEGRLPYPSVLLKSFEDHKVFLIEHAGGE